MNGWQEISTCPYEQDRGRARPVLVWHTLNGVMVSTTHDYPRNSFFVRWMEIPNVWIDVLEHEPKRQDADMKNCVLIRDHWGNIRMKGYHQVDFARDVRQWQPMPAAPADYEELRRR